MTYNRLCFIFFLPIALSDEQLTVGVLSCGHLSLSKVAEDVPEIFFSQNANKKSSGQRNKKPKKNECLLSDFEQRPDS